MIGTRPATLAPDQPLQPPSSSRLRGGRLDSTRTPRRWACTVASSGLLVCALVAVGLPRPVALVLGLVSAVAVISDLIAGLVLTRFRRADRGMTAHQSQIERMLADEFMDGSTHGWLGDAHEALVMARSRFARVADGATDELRIVAAALTTIREIEDDLRDSQGKRRDWEGRPPSSTGAYAATAVVEDPDVLMKLHSDPANLPDRLGPRGRDVLARAGAVLDDVRVLNTPQTEWAVLLFTLWARAMLVCGAPLLASQSFGELPWQSGPGWQDLPWALAAIWAIATALLAPRIATDVMRHDDEGARARRVLLAVEVPLAVAAIVCTPCWPVVAFAAGWTNWWQRPDFGWLRQAAWIAIVGSLLAAGMALRHADPAAVAAEFAIAMGVVALIGASYGAMLPVSASLMARTLVGGLLTPRRARDRADVRIGDSINHLLDAARAIEQRSPDDPQAARDVGKLRESARMLGVRADVGDRWARRTPLGLDNLVDGALDDAGVMSNDPRAYLLLEQARLMGGPEPVTLDEPTFHQRRLARARFRERRHARALRLLVTEVVLEARRHGTGPLVTICRLERDRVLVRFANVTRPGPARPGRGNGAVDLRRLASSLPDGRIDTRGPVDGSFVDLPARAARFGVQLSFSTTALHTIDELTETIRGAT